MNDADPKAAPDPLQVDPAAVCPSCGRFAGPRVRCPHCGAGMRLRASLRILRWGSVLVAVLGLFFLYLWARNREVPTMRAGELTETMNMAYVRLEGDVGRVSVLRDAKGRAESVQFDLDDGTAVARVRAFRHAAETLEATGKIPARGDRARAAGTVRVGADGEISLLVQTAEHVEVTKAEVPRIRLSAAGPAFAGRVVEVEGVVTSVRAPREGSKAPYKVILRDEDDTGALVVWARTFDEAKARGLREGARILARVSVGEHGGELQLVLEDASDFTLESGASAPAAPPSAPAPGEALSPAEAGGLPVGKPARIRGTVERIEPPPPGSRRPGRVVLSGGGGILVVVAWEEEFRAIASKGLARGDTATASGVLSDYQGELQLKLARARDLEVTGRPGAPDSKSPPPEQKGEGEEEIPEDEPPEAGAQGDETPLAAGVLRPGMVTRDQLGQAVVVEGIVEKTSRQRSGRRVLLAGGGATLVVFIPDPVAKGIPGLASLARGDRVRVRGKVAEHRGTLEVLPAEAGDFTVLERACPGAAEGKAPAKRTAASLGKPDVGDVVVLEGTIASLKPIPRGTRLTIEDGSGAAAVVIVWDSVKQKMKDPAALAEKKRIRVAGKVGEYKGDLQVVPEEGWDVNALE